MRTRLLTILMALIVAACGGGQSGGDEGGGGEHEQHESVADEPTCVGSEGTVVEVAAAENFFTPTKVKAPAGEMVTIHFVNEGSAPHTFTVDDPSCHTANVSPGDTIDITFEMPEQETPFHCHIHDGMEGTLVPA